METPTEPVLDPTVEMTAVSPEPTDAWTFVVNKPKLAKIAKIGAKLGGVFAAGVLVTKALTKRQDTSAIDAEIVEADYPELESYEPEA